MLGVLKGPSAFSRIKPEFFLKALTQRKAQPRVTSLSQTLMVEISGHELPLAQKSISTLVASLVQNLETAIPLV